MLIPGSLIAKLTFPGILVQNKIRKNILEKNKTTNYRSIFLIVLLPLLANTALCFTAAIGYVPLYKFGENGNIIQGILALAVIWLSFSFGMHAFPYKDDAKQFWSLANKAVKDKNTLGIIGYPIAIIIYIFDLMRFVWIDAIYPVFVVWLCWHIFGIF